MGLLKPNTASGVMYDQGRGVPQDHTQAYAWTSVATANGATDAAAMRDTIAETLTGAQRAAGQRLAAQ